MKNVFIGIIFISSFLLVESLSVDLKLEKDEEMRFIYISYLEYLTNFTGNSVKINQSKINKMIDNIILHDFNTIIIQVSPFSDAIYESDIFPYSYTLTGKEGKNPGFDYLAYFIKMAHIKKVKVHAWINPYRISSHNDITKIANTNPAIKFLNTENIGISQNGIYYDPTSELVKQLIEKQVMELIKKYDLDGIHFDDYFYIDYEIDDAEYQEYISDGEELSLAEFRLMHTNDLIERIGLLIKKNDPSIIFSISPDGNINNNYKYHYADVKNWIKEELVDIIMPQLYYGFSNQYLPFEKAYNVWNDLIINSESSVKLVPVLAFYKVGNVDNGAGSGKNEWLQAGVIEKQISFLKSLDKYSGFGLFRYDFLFNENVGNSVGNQELINIRNLCK